MTSHGQRSVQKADETRLLVEHIDGTDVALGGSTSILTSVAYVMPLPAYRASQDYLSEFGRPWIHAAGPQSNIVAGEDVIGSLAHWPLICFICPLGSTPSISGSR